MILKAFAVFDVKAECYNAPFFFPAVGQAVRAFTDLANDEKTTVGRYPDDFKLVKLGEFDDATGVFVTMGVESLGFGSEYVRMRGHPVGVVSAAELERRDRG